MTTVRRFTYTKPEEFLQTVDFGRANDVVKGDKPVIISRMNRHHPVFHSHHKVYGICVRYEELPCIFITSDRKYASIDCFEIPGMGWFKNIRKKLVKVTPPKVGKGVSIIYSGMKDVTHDENVRFTNYTDTFKVFIMLERSAIYLGNYRIKYINSVYNLIDDVEVSCTFELIRV